MIYGFLALLIATGLNANNPFQFSHFSECLPLETPKRQISLFSISGSPSLITSAHLPVTIVSPGRYIVVQNCTYNTSSIGTAITINSNNVILDLLGFSVTQNGGVANVNGIVVNAGLTNIVIQNGSIKDFSNNGISIGAGCSQVVIDNLTLCNCGNRAIELVGSTASPLQTGIIKNCTFVTSCTLSTADNVITLSHCNDIDIQNCTLSNNGSTNAAGVLTLIALNNSFRCILKDIDTSNNIGNTDLRCYCLKQSSLCRLHNCNASTNIAWGATSAVYGIMLEGNSTSTANIFTECTVANLTGTTVDGFFSSTNCDDNIFIVCKALANQANATTGVVHGFRCITNNRNQFLGCIAARNVAPSSTIASPFYGAYGFRIETTTGTYLHQCIANDQTAASRAIGFFIRATTSCTADENVACRNTTFGFDANFLTFNNQAFVKNFALKNNIAGGAGSNQYNGFGTDAIRDGFTASNFGVNNTLTMGPISWVNLGIG